MAKALFEAIRSLRESGKELVEINGHLYEMALHGRAPTTFIWASDHVVNFGYTQWDDFYAQSALIKALRPEIVLHEFFLGFIYDPKTRHFTKRDTGEPVPGFARRIEDSIEPAAVKRLSDELGFLVVGCDSNASGGASDMERETEHAGVIERFKGTVAEPAIAIIGALHCHPGTYLNTLLQRNRISYVVIENIESLIRA